MDTVTKFGGLLDQKRLKNRKFHIRTNAYKKSYIAYILQQNHQCKTIIQTSSTSNKTNYTTAYYPINFPPTHSFIYNRCHIEYLISVNGLKCR